jgi:hypothetical protein
VRRDADQAWQILNEAQKDPVLFEHPNYQAKRAIVAARLQRTRDAREALQRCLSLSHVDVELMRELYTFESATGFGLGEARRICQYVIDTKGFSKAAKIEFASRYGTSLYFSGRQNAALGEEQGIQDLEAALIWHLSAQTASFRENVTVHHKADEYCRNTAWAYFTYLRKAGRTERGIGAVAQAVSMLPEYGDVPLHLDSICEPLISELRASLVHLEDSPRSRLLGQARRLAAVVSDGKRLRVADVDIREKFFDELDALIQRQWK